MEFIIELLFNSSYTTKYEYWAHFLTLKSR